MHEPQLEKFTKFSIDPLAVVRYLGFKNRASSAFKLGEPSINITIISDLFFSFRRNWDCQMTAGTFLRELIISQLLLLDKISSINEVRPTRNESLTSATYMQVLGRQSAYTLINLIVLAASNPRPRFMTSSETYVFVYTWKRSHSSK